MDQPVTFERAETVYTTGSDATDDITLRDTSVSEDDPEAVWPFDHIVAEGTGSEADEDGQIIHTKQYLVKWSGYSIYRATWEPEGNFDDARDVLFEWRERRMRELRSTDKKFAGFDIREWENDKHLIREKKIRRHQRRNKKRLQRGIPEIEYEGDSDGEADDEREFAQSKQVSERQTPESESEDDRPLMSRGRRPQASIQHESESDDHIQSPTKKRRLNGLGLPKITGPVGETSAPVQRPKEAIMKTTVRLPTNKALPSKPTASVKSARKASSSTASLFFMQSLSSKPAAGTANNAVAASSNGPVPHAAMTRPGPTTKARSNLPIIPVRRSTVAGADIFKDFSGPPVERKARKSAPGLRFKNLSHQHAAQKKAAHEAAPKLVNMKLVDAATGCPLPSSNLDKPPDANREQTQIQANPVVLPMRQESQLSELFHPLPEKEASAGSIAFSTVTMPAVSGAHNTLEDTAESVMKSESTSLHSMQPIESPASAHDATSSMTGVSDHAFTPLTCWFWITEGTCRYNEECGLAHFPTGQCESQNKSKTKITCPHWHARGTCMKGDSCPFAHHTTDYIASLRPGPIRRLRDQATVHKQPVSARRARPSKVEQSCYFWYHDNNCLKSASDCEFSHEMKAFIADANLGPQSSAGMQIRLPSGEWSHEFMPPAGVPSITSSTPLQTDHMTTRNTDMSSGVRPLISKFDLRKDEQSCHWWYYFGKCSKRSSCDFAHVMKDWIANISTGPIRSAGNRIRLPNGEWSNDNMPPIATSLEIDSRPEASRPEASTTKPVEAGLIERLKPSRTPSPVREVDKANGTNIISLPYINSALQSLASSAAQIRTTNGVAVTLELISSASGSAGCTNLVLSASLAASNPTDLKRLRQTLGSDTTLSCRSSYLTDNFKAFFATSHFPSIAAGQVLANSGMADHDLGIIAENLKLTSSALICFRRSFTIIFHPPGSSEWTDSRSSTGQSGTKLLYLVLRPVKDPETTSTECAMNGQPIASPNASQHLALDAEQLFMWHDGCELKRQALLIFPSERRAAQGQLCQALEAIGAAAYAASTAGTVEYFRRRLRSADPGGAIILESSLCYRLESIPFLTELVYRKLNFFEYATSPEPKLIPMFPKGLAVFILDGCFRDKAKNTMDLIIALQNRIKYQQVTKIVGRPDLINWLHELACTVREAEAGNAFISASDLVSRHIEQMHDKLYELVEKQAMGDQAPKPSEESPVFYLPSKDWPEYAEAERVDQKRADDLAVEWFAGWATQQAYELRKFTVVTLASDSQLNTWRARWRHLSFMDPRDYAAKVQ